jgi:hypothetical protein
MVKLRRIIAVFTLLFCIIPLAGCASAELPVVTPALRKASGGNYGLRAAVLYSGAEFGGEYEVLLGYLQQSTLVGLSADALDADALPALNGYDILYLDGSIALSPERESVADMVAGFTEQGGSVVLDNALWGLFDKSFIGAKDFVKLDGCPLELDFPALGDDLGEIQGVVSDFAALYGSYGDFEALTARDYGYAVVCDSAVSLASLDGNGLYTVNQYGDGLVFFTNPLLPNMYSAGGFDMVSRSDQTAFADTTAGCGQLLVNAYAGFVAKQLYGYYIGRVFGSFGSPDLAWELHYEEMTGIANDSMGIFGELCKEFLQVPSYTLIRNSYWWFGRYETVTYYLNEGDARFSLDFDESAYSSGTHIESGGQWLYFDSVGDAGSYFSDYPEYTQRAYPEILDLSGDGVADIVSGSADGGLYYCEGLGFDERLHVDKARAITDASGAALSVGGYSAPALADIDGDGVLDIVSGSADGDIYWFKGGEDLNFEARGKLLDTDIRGQSLPALGDIDGDGVTDLAVGSNEGILLVFYGAQLPTGGVFFDYDRAQALSRRCADAYLGSFLAPGIFDLDDDGASELAVGTFDGYVARFDESLSFSGYIETDEPNYKGGYQIKTGNNCVPRLYDINGDGEPDLVCGALEYGLAYPIDSEYFPYAEELSSQVDYAKENEFYLGVHFYTNQYASAEREAYELAAHKKALAQYGASLDFIGTNQHTWFTSGKSGAQSMLSAWNSALLWNSGYSPAGPTRRDPQVAAENVVSMPFFLMNGGQPSILMQNCSVLPYRGAEWTDISGKYGVPTCVYYHCDFVYESDAEARSYMSALSDFWWKHGYNFAGEHQLMAATAAAYNLTVTASGDLETGLSLTPGAASDDFPHYDENFQNASGVKLVFKEGVDVSALSVDADVWRTSGNAVYLGLNRPVSVKSGASASNHIERVNVPAEITSDSNGAELRFLDGGMMQVVVSGAAETSDDGWIITSRDGKTIFTKYGGADTLRISWENV